MRKILLLLLIECLGFTAGHASPLFGQDGGPTTTTTHLGDNGAASVNRPRAPRRTSSFQVVYDQALGALLISSPSDVGMVVAVVENLSTGAFGFYTFDTSELAILPISGEPGFWRVTLILSHTKIFYDFYVD